MHTRKDTSGIYTITNLVDNKIYVGKATYVKSRLRHHKSQLVRKVHGNDHLQYAVNRYGIDNFVFELLVECDIEHLFSEEHYWATLLDVHNRERGYNIEPTHPHRDAPSVSEETKEKLRVFNTGKKRSPEIRKRQSESWKKVLESRNGVGFTKGRKHTEEWKKANSERLKGKKRSVEHSIAISEGLKKRKPLTKKQVERGAAKRRGMKHDAEHARRTSENGGRLEIEKYDLDGNLICSFYSKNEAAIDAKVHPITMALWCRGKYKPKSNKGYVYKYKTKQQMKIEAVESQMGKEWVRLFKPFIESDSFDNIFKVLKNRSARKINIAPASSDVFRAFKETPPEKVRVILAGMCPYHTFENGKPIADGLCMSCSYTKNTKGVQPSLQQWYDELQRVYGSSMHKQNNSYGDMKWLASQGVLCYNVALTVEEGKPLSNQLLWKDFNQYFWEEIVNKYMSGVVIFFLGEEAQRSISYINPMQHYCIPLKHPASASYNNTNWDSEGAFKKADKILKDNNNQTIMWFDDLPF